MLHKWTIKQDNKCDQCDRRVKNEAGTGYYGKEMKQETKTGS